MSETTRRAFIRDGSVSLAGALSVLYMSPGFVRAASAAVPTLNQTRIETFEAILRALAEVPRTRVKTSDVAATRQQFVQRFASLPAEQRAMLAALLDELNRRADTSGGLPAQTPARNLALLRRLHGARTLAERRYEAQSSQGNIGPAPDAGERAAKEYILAGAAAIRKDLDAGGPQARELDSTTGLSKVEAPKADAPSLPINYESDAFMQRAAVSSALMTVSTLVYPPNSDGPPL